MFLYTQNKRYRARIQDQNMTQMARGGVRRKERATSFNPVA
jgi:hypothetical protein